jgi:hypothetical protein
MKATGWIGFSEDDGTTGCAGGSASPEDDASPIAEGADIRRHGRGVSPNALRTTRSTLQRG